MPVERRAILCDEEVDDGGMRRKRSGQRQARAKKMRAMRTCSSVAEEEEEAEEVGAYGLLWPLVPLPAPSKSVMEDAPEEYPLEEA